MIRRLADQQQVTVLLSSHLLHQVQAVCDRVAYLRQRVVVVAQGTPADLASRSRGPEEVEVVTPSGEHIRIAPSTTEIVHAVSSRPVARQFHDRGRPGSDEGTVNALVVGGVEIDAVSAGFRRS